MLTGQRANRGRDRAGGHARNLTEQAAAIEKVRAQPLRDREHHLPVRHGRQTRGIQPLRPEGEALGVATRAEVPAFARERQQVFVRTTVTANAREAMLEDPAGQELVRYLPDDRAPRAVLAGKSLVVDRLQSVEMVLHQPEQGRRLRASRPVDAGRRRRRVVHAHAATVERRAYASPARGASPSHCRRGSSDATSTCRRPNDACC